MNRHAVQALLYLLLSLFGLLLMPILLTGLAVGFVCGLFRSGFRRGLALEDGFPDNAKTLVDAIKQESA